MLPSIEQLSKKKGFIMAQISLAWMLSRDVVSAPIIGSTSLERLHDLVGVIDMKLSEDEIK
ncbi:hypothetical protein EWM64_g7181 [Hericium alpestre]|uniref:NADP-dependent oxidoreductase domain-containing protein n=1 Tax=Hericium alpestre TaxID=135208 RepID=A0A4Y9ZS12_9AGAM|nr:hypothetical protein EWM64_g7181 [Hericium alpestre]